ncbi:MAG: hypothetical protein IH983_09440 [Planctomycetes bacterium]|nr:hypothetical protein [Planctomycetota bacterium]
MPPGVNCIYCGGSTSGVRRGEHVIPEALGGTQTLRCVCRSCNTAFSVLDKELCSRSPLSIVVQQELGTKTGMHWDYNEEYDIALEARILRGFLAPVLWPQLVLLGPTTLFLFDQEEAESVGLDDYANAFHNLVHRSTEQWLSRRKGIIWERIRRQPDRGRFPPRFFSRHEYADWKRGMTFICRYLDPIEREQIVHAVRRWEPDITRSTTATSLGVLDPETLLSYQQDLILRALVKIGLNLLAYALSPTDVNSTTFPIATKYARWGTAGTPNLQNSGFVTGGTLSESHCPTDAHKFELVYSNQLWRLVAVFFGGRIGTCVHFPGPQITDYVRYEIVAPVKSKDWTVYKSKLHLAPRAIRTLWDDLSVMIPSMPIRHRGSRKRVEQRRRGK